MRTKESFKEFILPKILNKFTPRIQQFLSDYEKLKFTHPLPPFGSYYVYSSCYYEY